jgi:hypothetical protein
MTIHKYIFWAGRGRSNVHEQELKIEAAENREKDPWDRTRSPV